MRTHARYVPHAPSASVLSLRAMLLTSTTYLVRSRACLDPAPSHRSHSQPMTPQPQHYIPTPTLESLDTEGMTQIDPETSDELLHHWAAPTTAAQPTAAGASDDDDLVENDEDANEYEARIAESSVDWKQAREGSIGAKPWWRRPSPYW